MQRLFKLNRASLIGTLIFLTSAPNAWAQELPASNPRTVVLGLQVNNAPKNLNNQYINQVATQVGSTGHTDLLTERAVNIVFEDRNIDARRANPVDALMAIDQELKSGEDLLYENPQKAVKAFRNLNFRITKLLRESGSNFEVWIRSFNSRMLLARALLDSGRKDDASYTLRDTIRVFGTSREVSMTTGYHPTLVRAYEQSLKSLKGEQNGHLTVDSQPTGAVIVLNGQVTKQTTPHEFTDLFPGAYHVKISTPTQVSLVHYVEVDARGTARLQVDLETENHLMSEGNQLHLRFDSPAGIKDKVVKYGTEIGKWLGVDYVVVMGLVNTSDGEKLRSYLIHVVGEKRVSYESVAVPVGQFSVDAVQRTALAMTRPWHTGGTSASVSFGQGPILGWSLIGAGTITLGICLYFALDYLDLKNMATAKTENGNPVYPKECPEPPDPSGPGCQPNDPQNSPYGVETRVGWAASANSSSTIGVVTGILGALMVGGGVWALMNPRGNHEQSAGTLQIDLPGGGQIVPVVGSEHTGFNLGYRF